MRASYDGRSMAPRTAPPLAWVQALVLVVAGALGLWMLSAGAQEGALGISVILAVLVGYVASRHAGRWLPARRLSRRSGEH